MKRPPLWKRILLWPVAWAVLWLAKINEWVKR